MAVSESGLSSNWKFVLTESQQFLQYTVIVLAVNFFPLEDYLLTWVNFYRHSTVRIIKPSKHIFVAKNTEKIFCLYEILSFDLDEINLNQNGDHMHTRVFPILTKVLFYIFREY